MSTSHSNGKIVLVTGAGTGFGRLTVERLAAAGYHVIATLREVTARNAATAESLREWARTQGHSIKNIKMDVSSDASVEGAIKDILARRRRRGGGGGGAGRGGGGGGGAGS